MIAEEWRRIPGFSMYEASSTGRIASYRKWRGHPVPREMCPRVANTGYLTVTVTDDEGTRIWAGVHRLVALAFCGARPAGQEIRHLDGNCLNNTVANLAYGTKSENIQDVVRHGRHNMASKTQCVKGHPFDAENTVYAKRQRRCRACKNEHGRRARAAATAARKQVAS